ncbi:MAG: GGDEF domain-containing protein [Alphaproteobacteria bacterium]|nr:GGDEF domain-containing protein [Alphaproteobacteria bacterium]
MVKGAEQHHADKWARQAMEHLKRDGLPPTPPNYAVYYYYYSDSNPNLKMAMDMLLGQYNELNQQQCSDLYQTHLGLEAEQKILKETNAAIEAEINRVLGVIDAAASGTNQFSKTLDTFSGKLTTSSSLDQIREAVTKVVAETRAITKQNERLASQLAQTTQQLTEMRYNLDQVHKESQIDPLTGVGNRKFFDKELAHTTTEAAESQTPLTLLMVDIDYFKKFNDAHGHVIGDQVLRLVAHTLVENLKGRDVIARYGGEEFVILLPQTRITDAEKVANQLRAGLSTKQIKRRSTNETLGVVTISVGAAEYCPGEDLEGFIARADSALYKAKQTGRNRVMMETLTPEQIQEIEASRPKPIKDAS